MHSSPQISLIACAALLLSACGGGGGNGGVSPTPTPTSTPSPAPTPSPTPSPVSAWAPVSAILDAHPTTDIAVVIGNGVERFFVFERGDIDEMTPLASASSAKMMAGITMMRLIDKGILSLDSRPADVLSDYWADDATDPRSEITLADLLSFTSGFNATPTDIGCWMLGGLELQTCAERIYNNGLDTAPGQAFAYGPEHLQVASAMAEVETGKAWNDIFRSEVGDPLNLSPLAVFSSPSLTNPRVSGGAVISADDYARILEAVLSGSFLSDTPDYLADRTNGLEVAYSPVTQQGGDWHYGLGFWLECDATPFAADCAVNPTISSPGAFGFTPWIDYEQGYYGVIAVEERTGSDAQAAHDLAQQLQPLITQALDDMGR